MRITLEKVLGILNRRRHRGNSNWEVNPKLRSSWACMYPSDSAKSTSYLSEFEAHTIAAEYLRHEAAGREDSTREV
jgi:hypothetical protein